MYIDVFSQLETSICREFSIATFDYQRVFAKVEFHGNSFVYVYIYRHSYVFMFVCLFVHIYIDIIIYIYTSVSVRYMNGPFAIAIVRWSVPKTWCSVGVFVDRLGRSEGWKSWRLCPWTQRIPRLPGGVSPWDSPGETRKNLWVLMEVMGFNGGLAVYASTLWI